MTAYLERASAFVLAKIDILERRVAEAVAAGVSGGATIAIWFLLLDALQGRPLYTPNLLGAALVGGPGLESPATLAISLEVVLLYTLIHGIAFCAVGYVTAWLFVAAEEHPPFIFALILLFIFFFGGFLAIASLFALPVLEALSIPMIVIGNLLAAGVMGTYLWRRHPLELRKLL